MSQNGTSNELVSVGEARRNLIPKKDGREVSSATTWRWINRGINNVRLKVVYVNSRPHTSQEMIRDFFARVTSSQMPKRDAQGSSVTDDELSSAGLN